MRRTAKIALVGGVALVVFLAFFFSSFRQPSRAISVRHVGSVQSGNVTTMTFEIKNHTGNSYLFSPFQDPFQVQVRNGNAWTRFQDFDITTIRPKPKLDAGGVASYTVNVTNLPAGSVVRFRIRPQKILLGFEGFVKRAELRFIKRRGGGRISLNPYDRNSNVFELPTEVVSEEFVEPGPNPSGQKRSDK